MIHFKLGIHDQRNNSILNLSKVLIMHFGGLILAFITIILIGVFHPIVIKSEYYFSTKCWPVFAVLGTIAIIGSLFIENVYISSIVAVLGGVLYWSIHELFLQRKRVIQGRFPKNPNRPDSYYQ